MQAHVEPFGLVAHGVEGARSLGGRNLDAVLRAVGEALLRVGGVVQVSAREADRAEEVARPLQGHASATSTAGAPGTIAAVSRACSSVVVTISFARAKLSSSVGTGPTGCPSA